MFSPDLLRQPDLFLVRYRDVDVVPVYLDWVGGDRLRGRRPGRLASAQVEARPVQPALDSVVVDLALRERDLFVRADVIQREQLTVGPHDRNGNARYLDADRALLGHLG